MTLAQATSFNLAQSQPWLDADLYPFQSHSMNIDGNSVHYIDEGQGIPLLMIHPLPSWSFAYRNIIPHLTDRFRCIALDMVGFGFSQAASGFEQSPRNHAKILSTFIERLNLPEVVIYGHDIFGGAALAAAIQHKDILRGLVMSTTFAWTMDDYPSIERFLGFVANPLSGTVITRMMIPFFFNNARYQMKDAWTSAEKRVYFRTFRPQQQANMRRMFRHTLRDKGFYLDLNRNLSQIADTPILLPWGTEDHIIEEGWLARFEQIFPNHTSVILDGVHHFPQENAPQRIVHAIRAWADKSF